jgi:predicted HicB family RNase H-like nuclease
MEYDAEDHILVGRVSGIKDIIAFHGETVSEFEEAFRASVDNYLLACEKVGKTPAKPASGKLMLRIPPAVHCAALAAASAGQKPEPMGVGGDSFRCKRLIEPVFQSFRQRSPVASGAVLSDSGDGAHVVRGVFRALAFLNLDV